MMSRVQHFFASHAQFMAGDDKKCQRAAFVDILRRYRIPGGATTLPCCLF
jgi:hypothetical protein